MNIKQSERLRLSVERLSEVGGGEEKVSLGNGSALPSAEELRELIGLVKNIIFPGFPGPRHDAGFLRSCHIGIWSEQLTRVLQTQIARSLTYADQEEAGEELFHHRAEALALDFMERLIDIKRLLYSDVEAMVHNDPAVESAGEVIFCYPMVIAMIHYRVAHELLTLGVPVIPRIITELAHSLTGIDIHPGAQIGPHFCMDHGTGIVIGETAVIGHHVMLYQGVTLGAKSFSYDDQGKPQNLPRHPIIEDNVTIYSNTSVLGRITIGHDSIIGGNVWQTRSVPPFSHIVQSRTATMSFADGAGI